jgi:hypothetical protein
MFKSKSTQPRTVAQITQNLKNMVDDLAVSEAAFEEKKRQNDEEIHQRITQNSGITAELAYNQKVATKLNALFGGDE